MRRERLIRPTVPTPPVDLIRRASIASGDFTSLKKLRPQSVTSRIQPGSDVIVCAEMDEQWGYVGAKSRQRWLFYAYDSLRKTVVAHVFGERTMATLGRLMSLLSPFDVVIWMTDGWPLYESRLKGKHHLPTAWLPVPCKWALQGAGAVPGDLKALG